MAHVHPLLLEDQITYVKKVSLKVSFQRTLLAAEVLIVIQAKTKSIDFVFLMEYL